MDTEQPAESDCNAPNGSFSSPNGNCSTKGTLKRTPLSRCKKVHSRFKSPLQRPPAQCSTTSPEEEIRELRRKREELDTQIALLHNEGYSVEELEQHIELLHEYNDIKDIGQTLLGKIATLRGTTTRDLYSYFGLKLQD